MRFGKNDMMQCFSFPLGEGVDGLGLVPSNAILLRGAVEALTHKQG